MRDDGFAGRSGEQLVAQADDTARRNVELAQHPVAFRLHAGHGAFAGGNQLDGASRDIGRQVDGQFLHRLALLPVDLLDDHLGLADLKFVTLTAHRFDEYRQVQHATAVHDELVGGIALRHAHGQVLFQFLFQAFADVAAGYIFTVLAEERRIVDRKEHRHRRFVDGDGRQRFRSFEIGEGVPDLEIVDSRNGANIPRQRLGDFHFAQTFEHVQFLDFGLFDRPVAFDQADVHPLAHFPTGQTPHGNTSGIARIVDRGNEHLGIPFRDFHRLHLFQHQIQQREHRIGRLAVVGGHPPLFGRAEDDGKIQLFVRGSHVHHQVENRFVNFLGGAVFLVHFVDHHDGVQVHVQCLLKHETRLGHRAFEGIDQQQHAVGHIEHALYFSAEIGVPGGVNDVDLGILVTYRNVLGKDRDPPFAFDLVVVQDEFPGLLVVAEEFAGIQKFVHQRGFPVVHVRDDGDIANVVVHTSPSLFGMCKVTKKAANAGSPPWVSCKLADPRIF